MKKYEDLPMGIRPDPAAIHPDDHETDLFHPDDGIEIKLTRGEKVFASIWWIGMLLAFLAGLLLTGCQA